VQRQRISLSQGRVGAEEPFAVELDAAGGTENDRTVTREQGEGAGLLVDA
jgi:hypothetical protein